MGREMPDSLTASLGRVLLPGAHTEVMRSTVRLGRLTFSAAAASIFLYDERRDQLIFEASSGEGEDRLLGLTIPPGHGVAGWVFQTGETVVCDVSDDPRFDREFAARTGYVPETLMAAPLELDEHIIGVLQVLDPALDRFGELAAIDLLTELANQLAITLALVTAIRGREVTPLHRLESALSRTEAPVSAVDELLDALGKFVLTSSGRV
ncbi:GAF domain-containing protein [Nonomuraea sp. NPDC050663]|uniref:GAF domain-containing protein n=1 Tax=Nonomuraea sp. NPDC050663 TaxID=3364370 RepID=UPI0017DE823B|nr:GAF domain-containing protein [Thermoactinospora sp.]